MYSVRVCGVMEGLEGHGSYYTSLSILLSSLSFPSLYLSSLSLSPIPLPLFSLLSPPISLPLFSLPPSLYLSSLSPHLSTSLLSLSPIPAATQQWSDIVREVKFLYSCDHENCIRYKGCYLKDQTCWVSLFLSLPLPSLFPLTSLISSFSPLSPLPFFTLSPLISSLSSLFPSFPSPLSFLISLSVRINKFQISHNYSSVPSITMEPGCTSNLALYLTSLICPSIYSPIPPLSVLNTRHKPTLCLHSGPSS